MLGTCRDYFDVVSFHVWSRIGSAQWRARRPSPMAVVKVKIGDEHLISAAEGNGPVNALDLALRKDLGKFSRSSLASN